MKPRDVETLITVLIGVQIAAILTLVAATFAAVVVDIPLYPAMLLLGGSGLILLWAASAQRHRAVGVFGLSAVAFALFYYICLYVFRLPLSPLYLAVLAYALVSIAGAAWLLVQLRRRA